ncbi:MAG: hypothetical protein NXY59_07910 [Aigarchaeota archaeon]|nr:hypothetical protein [Candidatus Pelearchaeum maunauluense]
MVLAFIFYLIGINVPISLTAAITALSRVVTLIIFSLIFVQPSMTLAEIFGESILGPLVAIVVSIAPSVLRVGVLARRAPRAEVQKQVVREASQETVQRPKHSSNPVEQVVEVPPPQPSAPPAPPPRAEKHVSDNVIEIPETATVKTSVAPASTIPKDLKTTTRDLRDLDQTEQRIVEALISGELREMRPVRKRDKPEGGRYPQVEELLDIDTSKAMAALDGLARKNILKHKGIAFKTVNCPSCKTSLNAVDFVCRTCHSPNIYRQRIIQHQLCGYMGPEEMFVSEEGVMRCPRCREEITIGAQETGGYVSRFTVQYSGKIYSVFFRCLNCGDINPEPETAFICTNCGKEYGYRDFEPRIFYEYVPNEEALARLREAERPLKTLIEITRTKGYEVEAPKRVVGASGVVHRFDALIRTREGVAIGIVFLTTTGQLSVTEVMRASVMMMDTNINRVIAISSSPISEDAARLADFLRITLLHSPSAAEFDINVLPKILEIIKQVTGETE